MCNIYEKINMIKLQTQNVKLFTKIFLLFSLINIANLSANVDTLDNNGTNTEYIQNLALEVNTWSIGVYGMGGINYNTAEFANLPGIPSCCPRFTEGSGNNFGFGLLFEDKLESILPNLFYYSRLGYFKSSSILTTEEETAVLLNNGTYGVGVFEHSVDNNFEMVNLNLGFKYNIEALNTFNVYFGALSGIYIGSNYYQKEQIIVPNNSGTFLDANGFDSGKRIRNESTGELPDLMSTYFGLNFAFDYELPLNSDKNLRLVPEISYYLPLSNVLQQTNWKQSNLNFGLSLKYNYINTPTIEYEPSKVEGNDLENTGNTDVISYEVFENNKPKETPPEILKFNATFIDEKGNEQDVVTFKVEETYIVNMTPLLNYIFFEDGKSELQDKYVKLKDNETSNFIPEEVNSPLRLPTYYHILNIVGKRMQKFPNSNLNIIGCNSDKESEIGDKNLSLERAKTVQNYLLNTWKINPSRLSISSRNLPEKPSNINVKDGIEENRRVEIYSNEYEILKPIITFDTIRVSNPPVVTFSTDIKADNTIRKWTINAKQNDKIVKTIEGIGEVPKRIDWDLSKDMESIPSSSDSLIVELDITDIKDLSTNASDQMPVEQLTVKKKKIEKKGDKLIERYSLILFEVRSAELSMTNKKIIDFVKKRVKPNSFIRITGFTDRLGDEEFNQNLAENRAKKTADVIGRKENMKVSGLVTRNLYDNDLPEGRFYCRTVDIYIETPLTDDAEIYFENE